MNNQLRRELLQTYRKQREATNINPVGEATGRTYIPFPQDLLVEGKEAHGVQGFVHMFGKMLDYSPVEVRPGELIIGDYYYLLPYEIIPMDAPVDYETCANMGAMPGVPMGHTSVNAETGLELGWAGILERIKEYRVKFSDDSTQAEFLDGEVKVVHLIQDRIRDYGNRTKELADETPDPEQKKEYESIADRCFRLVNDPPRSFHDALQWYFLFVIFERASSSGMGSIRLDQVFYPFYREDIQAGILDDQQAQMLLECVFMKEPLFWSIGGVTPLGEDASNSLSFLAIQAYNAVGGTSNLSFRWHPEVNTDLESMVMETLARHGTGVPSVVNDQVIVPSLVEFGFPIEQARKYAFAGCFWWDVPGKEYTYHDLSGFSGVRTLMRALTSGRPGSWDSFESLWAAYETCVDEGIQTLLEAYQKIDAWLPGHFPEMVVSLLMDGCLEKGRNYNDQGPERNMMTILYVGLANVVNSLYAIKKHIFDDKTLTPSELMAALEENFQGHERTYMLLKNTPKYGNGNDDVDQLAVKVAENFKDTLRKYHNSKGDLLRPAFYSWHRQTFEGSVLGATPDGRLAGEPLAYAGNPSPGTTRQGITAAIQSMTRINYKDTAGGPIFLLLQREKDSGLMQETITHLVRSSFALGAPHIIINIADGSILRKAIEKPEEYSDLVIRVTGYSARFVQMERRYQEEIAARNSY